MSNLKATALIFIVLVIILSVPYDASRFHVNEMYTFDGFIISDSVYDVTITISSVQIIEDRDYLDAEIYLRASIDGGSASRSSTYTGINDGDTIQLDWTIFDGRRSSYTILVEIWEEDDALDDYLGQVEYSRNPPINHSSWYNAAGSIGGDNDLQAKVKIIETAYLDPRPLLTGPADKTFSEGTTGHFIRWIAFDDNPDSYVITRDGDLVDTGSWVTEEPIVCYIDGLQEGEYDYHIAVTDTDGYQAEDLVHVTVIEAATTSTTTNATTYDWFPGLSPPVLAFFIILGGAAIMIIYFCSRRSSESG